MGNFQLDSTWGTSAVFSPDRKSFVFEDEGTIQVWNVNTGEPDGESMEGHTIENNRLSSSPDGQYLASGLSDRTIMIWDINKRRAKAEPFRKHAKGVEALEFSPNRNNIVPDSGDRSILVWSVPTGEVLRKIQYKGGVNPAKYSSNGLFILAGGQWWMRTWDVADDTTAPKVCAAADSSRQHHGMAASDYGMCSPLNSSKS